ncbi:hypothetical protein [Tsukamurella paurometabola]|uniref:Cold-shock protein n=1 Tax=Tsukamurella paurometabola TaxID=2061 RepID=A0ABS5NGC5_TSUPA|nr:hypothetical protein [Tsukamurella paurometabola]MBS4103075.1 hypothetical protein [Tsukamurella paurometabola]
MGPDLIDTDNFRFRVGDTVRFQQRTGAAIVIHDFGTTPPPPRPVDPTLQVRRYLVLLDDGHVVPCDAKELELIQAP